ELGAFRPRAMARTALAAASTTPPRVEVLATICSLVAEGGSSELAAFEPRDIVALSWALAASGHRDVPAMTAIGWQLADRAWEFSGDELAKVLRSFAELGLLHQGMMATVSMETMWKIDQFSARSLAQVAESCARLGYCKEPMFDWLACRVIGRIEDYAAQDLASVMWAFGQASFKNEALAQTVAAE
ncbi:unnamed protein product, partial [Polarella glacialis]